MSITIGAGGALGGLLDSLFTASWRGVEFHMPDSRTEAGRRLVTFLFPGSNALVHEDIGGTTRVITVTGLILGDDYVRRAQAMEDAFRARGPGTLVHPWLGELDVVLAKPAAISFSERELRVARFDAMFERVVRAPSPLDTLGRLIAAIDGLRAEARAFLRRVLAPVRLALGTLALVSGLVGSVATTWRTVLAGVRGGGLLRAALAGPLDALAQFTLPITSSSPGGALADAGEAVPRAASSVAFGARPPAVGPGALAPAAIEADPRAAGELLLGAAAALAGGLAAEAPLRLALRAQAAAEAARVVPDIPFESRAEARSWRGRLDAALAGLVDAAAAAAAAEPEAAGRLLAALHALRAAALADLDERIGRLPEVREVTVPMAGLPAWIVAQHVAGDDPARLVAAHRDLVARNRIRHPALIEGGRTLEILA